VAVKGKPFYFDNPLKNELAIEPGRTYILRGPRQVGKTTLMKEMIARAVTSGSLDPKNCIFLTCEGMNSHEELRDTVVDCIKDRRGLRLLLCLDEITFVPGWQRAILWLFNAGLLADTTTFISGSNARDLKEMGGRFPGRKVTEKKVHPLSPGDYRLVPCFSRMSRDGILQTFCRIGGFPHAVRDFCTSGGVSDETCETYANWIFGDAYRFGLTREI
jgi:predicted AAA+ superfamily ATPase